MKCLLFAAMTHKERAVLKIHGRLSLLSGGLLHLNSARVQIKSAHVCFPVVKSRRMAKEKCPLKNSKDEMIAS